MSTEWTRNYNWVNDKNASIAITASRQDLELDDIRTKLNQKVVIKATAPTSPIADMIWLDSSVTPAQPKQYNGSSWTDLESIKGADIASAATTDIGAATGRFVDVTGTTTITGLGTIRAGVFRIVRFTGALTLTHNATSLILPGAANITTAANDCAGFLSLGSGNWLCVWYQPAAGVALGAASQAQMETATSNAVAATPGRTQYHPGVAKSWAKFNGTGTPAITTSYNMDSSITDNGAGDYTLSHTTDFSSGNYVTVGMCGNANAGATTGWEGGDAQAAGTVRVKTLKNDGTVYQDQAQIWIVSFGDQ